MKLEIFSKKLLEWNSVHNLSGVKTKEEIQKNIDDSLKALSYIDNEPKVALDIGTGAGFPGLVLAIAMPQTKWILVEPRAKRASFLYYIKTTLNLDNVEVKRARIEEIKPFQADLITSRAVMKTKDLVKLSRSFITPHTLLLFFKGEEVENELKGLKKYQIFQEGRRRYLKLKGEDVI